MLLDLIDERAEPTDDIFILEDTESSYKQASDTFNNWKKLARNEQNEIFHFLCNTSLYFEMKDYIFTHAVIRNTDETVFQKSKDELIWNYKHEPIWNGKRFIHGHLPTADNNIEIIGNGININTNCGYGGVLTGLHINFTKTSQTVFKISERGSIIAQTDVF
jgi:hypothetical protein